MVHRELLTVLLVCCLGLSLVAAQPALAGDGSDVSPFDDDDGLAHEDSGEETAEKDETAEEDNASDGSAGADDESDTDDDPESGDSEGDEWGERDDDSNEGNSSWRDSDNESQWSEDSDDGPDDENGSDYRDGMDDSESGNESEEDAEEGDENGTNATDDDASEERMEGSSNGTADDESDGGDDARNSSARANETSDRFLLDDVADVLVDVADVRPNRSANASDAIAGERVTRRGDARGWPVDRDGDGDADDATLRRPTDLDRSLDGDNLDRPLDASGVVDDVTAFVSTGSERGAIAGVRRTVGSVASESALLSDVVAVLVEPPAEDGADQLSTDGGYERAADGESLHRGDSTGTSDRSGLPEPSDGASDDESTDDEAAAGSAGGDGGEGPSSAPAEGAALLVFVGYLGAGRTALNQAAMLASLGQPNLLVTLQQSLGHHLGGLSDRVVPPVFGYSRHDNSDPLENETRARIYDLVRDSPGMYYAQLAEETDVTVETIRYHCRILADEGLVERRKLRGRQRLYPVTMDDDPELAAAIADSAASDVLSAIERREPTTLSSVADAIDCAPSTVSYHLDRLEEDGLVSRERDGGSVRIRLRRATKSALRGSVADD